MLPENHDQRQDIYVYMEPITPAFFKNYSRISGEVEDDVIDVFIQAAREKAEAYCNSDFVSKTKEKTFRANVQANIPTDDIISVTGFYTTLDEVAGAYNYWVEYTKGIIISRDYPICYDNIPTYTLRYAITVDPAEVPALVKVAIAKIAADLYENRENSTNLGNQELSINFKSLLAPYRKINLV